MALSRHSSRVYMDEFDLDGVLNVLSNTIADHPDDEGTPYYVGAHLALNLIRNHEEIRDQSVFMQLFANQLNCQLRG